MAKLKRPLNVDKVIEFIGTISEKPVDEPITRGSKGAIVGIIDSLLGGREFRNEVLIQLFPGKWESIETVTSNDLTEGEWIALNRWVGPVRPEGENWQGSPDFLVECSSLSLMASVKKKQEKKIAPKPPDDFFKEFCTGRFGHVPVMACGHEANALTALFNPFCMECADSGKNKLAYKIAADIPLKEQDVNESNIDNQ